ncbi:hypothetical protein ACHAW5_009352 [Stephanodiscus triporus]|uniref:dCMP deaminase n=1 Tax=Stephanodiscus triporus TaxID=2934178 RepID=A0ABD3N7Y6_9STRA
MSESIRDMTTGREGNPPPDDDGENETSETTARDDRTARDARRRDDIIRLESRGYDVDSPNNVKKRHDYLSWDDYFLAVARLSARRSKDPSAGGAGGGRGGGGGGACVVDSLGRIVGIGYDGFPRGCSDDCLPWASSSSSTSNDGFGSSLPWLQTKEPYLCRAEINAILNKCSSDVVGGRMFVPNFPPNECAKFIIQSGIREVRYVDDDDPDSDSSRASRILFEVSGVKMTKIKPGVSSIRIDFGEGTPSRNDDGRIRPDDVARRPRRDEEEMEKYLGLLRREASMDPFDFEVGKGEDYLSWDEYFMGVAFLSGQRSKDPSTQVGACLVDADRCIVGIGYNGFPRGCSDDVLPWARSAPDDLHRKYPYVVHAEVNAILNKCSASVRGATLYVALFPCSSEQAIMEEQKIQALHDTLAKLKKTAGLGVASHYNFGKIKTKQVNGQTVREDGLPNNPLYFPFVKEGTFDPSTADVSKFGDGRAIKRNFDDCQTSANVDDGSERSLDKKSSKKERKKLAKEKKKADKKALKLEAKRQAKLEEKRREKLEAKKLAKKTAIKEEKHSNHGDDTNEKDKEKEDGKKKKSNRDKRKREEKEDNYAITQVEAASTPPSKTIKQEDTPTSTSLPEKNKKKSKKKDRRIKS